MYNSWKFVKISFNECLIVEKKCKDICNECKIVEKNVKISANECKIVEKCKYFL